MSHTTSYMDPVGRATSSTGAVPIYQQTGPQTYTALPPAKKKRPRVGARATVLLALAVGLVLTVPVSAAAMVKNGDTRFIPHAPSAADAKLACKSAIEEEAQGRLERANDSGDGTAVASLAGVDIGEPARTSSGYAVDGTIRFTLLSFLGSLPGTVFVTCEATISGSKLTTAVRNR